MKYVAKPHGVSITADYWRLTTRLQQTRSIFWLFIPIAFAFRLIYAGYRELVPDEAFYWVLSRHLSTGYLDHPPMVAYIIKLGTILCGPNELGVRCGAAQRGHVAADERASNNARHFRHSGSFPSQLSRHAAHTPGKQKSRTA